MKRIVIIGGGVSGLTAGIYARKAGFDVDIYEKNNVAGGECIGWDRNGFHIDNCIHWLIGTAEGTELNSIWKEVGAVGNNVDIISSDKMYTSELNGKSLTLWKDAERTRKEMLQLSPVDKYEINNLFRAVKLARSIQIPASAPIECMNFFSLLKMGFSMRNALKLFKIYEKMDTKDLSTRFKNELIRCTISDFCPEESMGQSFPMAYGNFVAGDGGIPKGGSRAMSMRMYDKLLSMGGKIVLGTSVEKINVDGNCAKSVTLSNGEIVVADYVISTCDPQYVFNKLLDNSYMDDVFKEIYSNRKNYPVYGMFQAAFAVDSPIDAINGDLMFDCTDIKTEPWQGKRMTVKNYAYEPSFAPAGKQIIQILWGLTEDAYDYWQNLYLDKTAYISKKYEIADAIKNKLERRFPEYANKLSILDTWTPVTYSRYCNAFKGYNQAYVITKNSMKNPYPSAYVKNLNNFILSGQWLSSPGGLPGAAIQGKYSVQRIMKKEKIKIKF